MVFQQYEFLCVFDGVHGIPNHYYKYYYYVLGLDHKMWVCKRNGFFFFNDFYFYLQEFPEFFCGWQ